MSAPVVIINAFAAVVYFFPDCFSYFPCCGMPVAVVPETGVYNRVLRRADETCERGITRTPREEALFSSSDKFVY